MVLSALRTTMAGGPVRRPSPRVIGALALLVAFAALALFAPRPEVTQLREWARAGGAWLPVLFFLAHVLATVVLPRVPFTLAAGLLFGPVVGVVLAVSATTVSAALAFLLVRAIGREAIATRWTHPAVVAVDRRLARRGWPAVVSLRLISPVPFWLVNFCAGVSSIRLRPFLVATAVGVLPGTVALVALGDALTGSTDPTLLAVSVLCVAIGVAGLVVDARLGGPEPV
ncbi:TVP38/TMEM64 family protein [Nocardia wallacei]|uniref:TVP38/TMEM64 family membrane protein n=1 Tax=Nocardia wallacei TaxID=480035 RepID=A0A7G1KNZ6_9NOCA|nr:TVP38/TMEM64 family protein [Nocardia wallacei]BCK54984.1 TVP38/TMEM64 family protein [Nocardia wallacei]